MGEASARLVNEIDPDNSNNFRINCQIGDLAYVLEGTTPTEPTGFSLTVALPDAAWQQTKPQVELEASENSWFAHQYTHLQQRLHLGDGKVGSVWVSAGKSPDGVPTIHVDRIQTELGYIPEGNAYHNAKGVGSAILDNLCALADVRGWRVTLYPLERDGRLMGEDLVDWYARRGFKFASDAPEDEAEFYPRDNMMRLSQTVDNSQPIVQAIT